MSNRRPDPGDPRVDDALSLLIDGATNYAIYMLDPQGRVAIWNRGAERIKGWSELEIVGQTTERFYLPADVASGKPERDLDLAKRYGRLEEENWRVRKDGSVFLANVTITALYGPSNELRGFGKVVRDITEQRAAQAELMARENELSAILATVPDAVCLLDANFGIVSFSHTAQMLFGYKEVEMIGKDLDVLLAPGEARELLGALDLPIRGHRLIARACDGAAFPIELGFDRVDGLGSTRFVAFMRDLRERESTQTELHRLQTSLAQAARVSLLGVMGSTLAHELNQPISAVVNYTEAARGQLALGALPFTIDEALEGAVGEALRAGNIIRQLRSFIGRDELDKQFCDLSSLIKESCGLLSSILNENGVTVRMQLAGASKRMFVERIQIQQVLLNLIRNAVEAMVLAETRILTIITEMVGYSLQVSVCDTGCGIDDAVVSTMFEAFTSSKSGGMGVGLSICRTIVEAHGGRIAAATENGMTCVYFTLPTFEPQNDHN